MECIVRDAAPTDLSYISELERNIFGSDAYSIHYLYYLYNSCIFFKVALVEDSLVGYIAAKAENNKLHLITIAVASKYRRRGIGGCLLKLLIDFGRFGGFNSIFLEVSVNRPYAIRFYRKYGFKVVGYIRHYYSDGSDALIMELPLK